MTEPHKTGRGKQREKEDDRLKKANYVIRFHAHGTEFKQQGAKLLVRKLAAEFNKRKIKKSISSKKREAFWSKSSLGSKTAGRETERHRARRQRLPEGRGSR